MYLNKYFKNLPYYFIILLVISCSSKSNNNLTEYQKKIAKKIYESKTTLDLFYPYDTTYININDSYLLDEKPFLIPSQNHIFIVNPIMKNIIIVDLTGKVFKIFGSDGEGPGEFRNIISACTDELGNLYLFDNILGRVSKFNNEGVFLSFFVVKALNQYIRHIVAYNHNIYFHHAPTNDYKSFVTKFDSLGNSNNFILNTNNNYKFFYERGFLDGYLISNDSGYIYETNIYDLSIKKFSDKETRIFNTQIKNYKFLTPTKTSDYNLLSDNYHNSIIPLKLYLIKKNKILLKELLIPSYNFKKVKRVMNIFDASGTFLGEINLDEQHDFDTSDGTYLFKIIDPSLYPPIYKIIKKPFIIRYLMK